MLKINHSLKDEIRGLQAEILKHVGSECAGIPEAASVMSAVNLTPLKALQISNQPQACLCKVHTCSMQMPDNSRGGIMEVPPDMVGWSHSCESVDSTALMQMAGLPDAHVKTDPNPVETRSAEDIVRAVLGGAGRNGR